MKHTERVPSRGSPERVGAEMGGGMEKGRWRVEQVVSGEQGQDAEELRGERGVEQATGKLRGSWSLLPTPQRSWAVTSMDMDGIGDSNGQHALLMWDPTALSFLFSSFLCNWNIFKQILDFWEKFSSQPSLTSV